MESGQLHALAALPAGESRVVPIRQEVGCAPEPVWILWRQENPCSRWNSNSDIPTRKYTVSAKWSNDINKLSLSDMLY
jgi:hypothetical protein